MSDSNDNDSDGMSRRGFMRRTGAAGAGVVGASYMGSQAYGGPVQDAEAIAPAVAAGAGAVGGGVVVGGAGYWLGSDDSEEVQELKEQNANTAWINAYSRARFAEQVHDDTLDDLSAIVTALDAKTFSDTAFKIAERTEAGDTQGEVDEAAIEEVDRNIANAQRRLIEAHTVQLREGVAEYVEQIETLEEVSDFDVFSAYGYDEDDGSLFTTSIDSDMTEDLIALANGNHNTTTVELVDGSTVEVPDVDAVSTSSTRPTHRYRASFKPETLDEIEDAEEDGEWESSGRLIDRIAVEPPESLDETDVYEAFQLRPYLELFRELEQIHSSEVTMAQNLVENLYEPIRDGDVDAADIASGRAIVQEAQNADDPNQLAGFYRAIRFAEAETRVAFEFESGVESEGYLFKTNDDSLPVGETINPDNVLGQIHGAYEIMSLPDEVPGGESDVDIRVLDEDLLPEDEAYVNLPRRGISANTDSDGWASLGSVPNGTHNVTIVTSEDSVDDPSNTTITRTTITVDEDNDEIEIQADGTDTRVDDVGLDADDEEAVGSLVTDEIEEPFTITDTRDSVGGDIEFEERGLPDPDTDDPEDIIDDAEETAQERQRTEENRQSLLDDLEGAGVGGGFDDIPSFSEAPLLWLSGGIIVVAIGSAVMS